MESRGGTARRVRGCSLLMETVLAARSMAVTSALVSTWMLKRSLNSLAEARRRFFSSLITLPT